MLDLMSTLVFDKILIFLNIAIDADFSEISHAESGASPALRDRGGGKIKIGGKGFRRFLKAFFGQNFNVFFPPKAGDLQKKGLRRNPKAFSGRNHKFSGQNQVISKKKYTYFTKTFAKLIYFILTKNPILHSNSNFTLN